MSTPAKLCCTATIHHDDGTETKLSLVGREAWAALELVEAGERGCTPIDNPAPRWSHYVWLLRGHGINVETIHEDHGGPFSGTHARYVLRSVVSLEATACRLASPRRPLSRGPERRGMSATETIIAELPKNKNQTLRVALTKFNEYDLVALRVYFEGQDGQHRPGKSGVNFRVAMLPDIIEALTEAKVEAERPGLLKPQQVAT